LVASGLAGREPISIFLENLKKEAGVLHIL
jgi:hypothetical protein